MLPRCQGQLHQEDSWKGEEEEEEEQAEEEGSRKEEEASSDHTSGVARSSSEKDKLIWGIEQSATVSSFNCSTL
jgi:hypothetical protein